MFFHQKLLKEKELSTNHKLSPVGGQQFLKGVALCSTTAVISFQNFTEVARSGRTTKSRLAWLNSSLADILSNFMIVLSVDINPPGHGETNQSC